jgi:dTDP-4-amino-4,6-dideoxygalactose transaminase
MSLLKGCRAMGLRLGTSSTPCRRSPYQWYATSSYPISAISRRGLNLPSSVKLKEEDETFIAQRIREAVKE